MLLLGETRLNVEQQAPSFVTVLMRMMMMIIIIIIIIIITNAVIIICLWMA
jgi:hypothetical protein